MELSEFLLARIAEDEAVARTGLFDEGKRFASIEVSGKTYVVGLSVLAVLDDCEAKRRIVEDLTDQRFPSLRIDGVVAQHLLRLLALPYADRPEYREEWRP